ncbi:SigE family RNA polymerase sigma factor [Streptomyces sp. TLI_171]|uniref:SigE family RNA polymerase sigma factor n=1 Tax=Streptomyces sp. TLI_171 TaxID=1938859 RepID=UPI000C1905F6|nr:SigE family RNA polymerase sigma factor [Streptomyces sp. TLI_171]RKE19410.1 RNA polymerase sigma-70 factor (ECF subfamily) [Streptomyces sp. TLI_171]
MTEEEFTEFYRHSVRRLTGQLYVVTGDLHEAQDVVQEAFVRAWGHRRGLDRELAPEAWVRTVAGRLAISRWRRARTAARAWRRHGETPEVDGPDPASVDLARALRQLTERQRLCAALFYVCDLPVDRIAAETGLAPGTVKAHLSRARAALARQLDHPTELREHSDDLH